MRITFKVDPCSNCCLACSIAEALGLIISGVGSDCLGCVAYNNPNTLESYYLSGTASLNGSYTVTATTPSVRWEYTISGAFSYSFYNLEDCTDLVRSDTADVILRVDCVDGVYTLRCFVEDLEGSGNNYDLFLDLTGAELGDPLTNTVMCGGSATLSE